jgi:predicted signal transduction protein with EAL and GGDEF domain
LDQSFVHQISDHPNDSAIVRAIIDMGKNLKQWVIAEGIEHRNSSDFSRGAARKDKATFLAVPCRRPIRSITTVGDNRNCRVR